MASYQLPPNQSEQSYPPQYQPQTNQYADFPEVVPPADPPEWVAGGAEEVPGKDKEAANELYQSIQPVPPKPWWKRKRFLIGIAVLVVVAVALGAGLGIGLSSKDKEESESGEDSSAGGSTGGSDNTDSTESEEENPEPPDCKDTVCPRIVSMTVHDSALYVVARTIDDTIAYRRLTDDSWDDWEDLGDPRGRLISQPSTFAWNVANVIPRLDLVAVSTDDRTVYSRWHSEFEGWASPDGVEWRGLGPDAGSPIAMCSPFTDRLDLWGTDRETRNITKTEWYQKPDDEINEDGEDGDTNQNGWFYSAGNSWTWQPLKPSRSAPAVICRESSTYHDILFYANEDNALYHAAWSNEDEWQTSEPWQGDWIGDPTLYNSEDDPERWHFFGLQENDELYYLSWSSSSGQSGTYTDLISLGGSIISTPAVISLERGGLDIVALNTNGTLQHRHYDGSEWSADWEDLGVRAHSAPTIALLEDKVYIAAVAQSGSLRVWSRGDSVEEKWKNSLKTANLGGDLSLDFFTQDL